MGSHECYNNNPYFKKIWIGIHKTTNKPVTVIISVGVPYPKSDKDILDDPFVK